METKTRQSVCMIHGEYEEKSFAVELIGLSKLHWLGCPDCAKQREDKRNKAAAENKFISIMRSSGVPTRFRDKTIAGYECAPENKTAFAIVDGFLSDPAKTLAAGRCLVIAGHYGTGKTHLAVAIIREFAMSGISAMYTTADGLIRGYKASYDRANGLDESAVFASYAGKDLLVIDELGYQRGSEEDRRILTNIMDARYGAMRSTVIISNLTMQQIAEELGDRVIDRMREGGGKVALFLGSSKRAGV